MLMANPQKRRGDRGEREVAHLLSNLLGRTVRRKLGAGRADDTGDIHGLPDCVVQVKSYTDVLRAIREGLPAVELQRQNEGATHAVLFVRRRGGTYLAIQTPEQWCTMFRETFE